MEDLSLGEAEENLNLSSEVESETDTASESPW